MSRRLLASFAVSISTTGCFVQFEPLVCTRCFDAEPAADAAPDAGIFDAEVDAGARPYPSAIAEGMADQHSCAVLSDGTLQCWGDNTFGQLGISAARALRPATVSGVEGVDEVTLGFRHSCAKSGGEVWCFGDNTYGQIGVGSAEMMIATPALIPGLDDAIAISSGVYHTCALKSGGSVVCWGAVLPDQPAIASPEPLAGAPIDVAMIDCGAGKTAMITSNGELWVVGEAGDNALGIGSTTDALTPVHILVNERVRDVDLGVNHSCAVLESGELVCWGQNGNGMAGVDQQTQPVPRSVVRANVAMVTAGFRNSCFLRVDATVACFGENGYGTLGAGGAFDENAHPSPSAVAIPGAEDVQIYWYHACALYQRTVRCWGIGLQGQVGDGSNASTSFPITVIE